MDEKLDPKELALQMDGEALLDKLQANKPAAGGILGPDGVPVAPTQLVTKAMPVPSQASIQEMIQSRRDAREMRLLQNSRFFAKFFNDNEEAAQVRDIMYLCHQLLYWGRMELSGHDEMSDATLEDLDTILEDSILRNAKGYDVRQVVSRLQNKGIQILKGFLRKYDDLGRARKVKIQAIFKRLGDNGITLPYQQMVDANSGPFMPGKFMILAGDPVSTRMVFDSIERAHGTADKGKTYRLTTLDAVPEVTGVNAITMPLVWWRNCCTSLSKRDEVLEPIVDSSSLLVLVEDLETLFLTGEREMPAMERKSYALKRLYQWAVENLVAVVVADNPTQDVAYDKRTYGFLPSVLCKWDEKRNMLQIDGTDAAPPEPKEEKKE